MSNSKTVLVGICDEACKIERVDLKNLMKRALRVESRMTTKVLIEDEQRRYSIFCDRIEFYARRLMNEGKAETCDLGIDYLETLHLIVSKHADKVRESRLTANFCPHELLAAYTSDFGGVAEKAKVLENEAVQKKIRFCKECEQKSLNVVELTLPWVFSDDAEENTPVDHKALEEAFLALQVSDAITEDRGAGHFVALRNQIAKVAEETRKHMPAAVNFSDLRHDVIAEILNEYVYKSGSPMYVAVTYSDGSEAKPFPIMSLKPRKEEALVEIRKQPILDVGMMSARHANDGLDERVKIYWFRNQEISIGRTQAETDNIAYKKSKEIFAKLNPDKCYRISFYQTGFQPAVVGFYRALAEELIARWKKPVTLEVTPFYFMGGVYKKGISWS